MGTLHEDQYTFLSYLAEYFLGIEMLQTKFVEKVKNYILYSIFFFLGNCAINE